MKPILWNTNNYVRPSGVRATSGFPKETGYGHEEWNNSPRLRFTENGQVIQAFHTEGVGNAPVADNVGQTFVFMTASHDRVQQLVGIAGNATHLVGTNSTDHGADALKAERERLGELLRLDDLCEDAWAVKRVKQCYEEDRKKILAHLAARQVLGTKLDLPGGVLLVVGPTRYIGPCRNHRKEQAAYDVWPVHIARCGGSRPNHEQRSRP
ncbi:hypothetical protein ACFS07_35885 [Undibacterium arcticum]